MIQEVLKVIKGLEQATRVPVDKELIKWVEFILKKLPQSIWSLSQSLKGPTQIHSVNEVENL